MSGSALSDAGAASAQIAAVPVVKLGYRERLIMLAKPSSLSEANDIARKHFTLTNSFSVRFLVRFEEDDVDAEILDEAAWAKVPDMSVVKVLAQPILQQQTSPVLPSSPPASDATIAYREAILMKAYSAAPLPTDDERVPLEDLAALQRKIAQEPQDRKLCISLRTVSGLQHFRVIVTCDTTICEIKVLLGGDTDILFKNIRLAMGLRRLRDTETVASLNLEVGSVLTWFQHSEPT